MIETSILLYLLIATFTARKWEYKNKLATITIFFLWPIWYIILFEVLIIEAFTESNPFKNKDK